MHRECSLSFSESVILRPMQSTCVSVTLELIEYLKKTRGIADVGISGFCYGGENLANSFFGQFSMWMRKFVFITVVLCINVAAKVAFIVGANPNLPAKTLVLLHPSLTAPEDFEGAHMSPAVMTAGFSSTGLYSGAGPYTCHYMYRLFYFWAIADLKVPVAILAAESDNIEKFRSLIDKRRKVGSILFPLNSSLGRHEANGILRRNWKFLSKVSSSRMAGQCGTSHQVTKPSRQLRKHMRSCWTGTANTCDVNVRGLSRDLVCAQSNGVAVIRRESLELGDQT